MLRMRYVVPAAVLLASLAGPAVGQEAKPAAKAPVRRAAPLVVQPAVMDQDAVIAQLAEQFIPQFRQLHRAELHFLRTVADPTRQQYEKVAADGEAAVKAAAREYAKVARGMARDGADPRQVIADAVAKSVKAHLPAERAARYQTEIDLRAVARRRMIVANLVVLVDSVVVLTADQRRQLAEVLTANWNDAWNQTMYFQNSGRFFPPMPDQKIRPLLTEQQWAVWSGIPKGNVRFGVNLQMNGIEVEDEEWADDPPRKGDKPAANGPGPAKGKGGAP